MSLNALKNINGLDVDTGLANCMNDEELYLQVVEMFQQQLSDDIAKLELQFQNQSWEDLGKTSHGIKGAAASVGAVEVQKLASVLELAGKENNAETITNTFPLFTSAINELHTSLLNANL